MKNAQIIHRSRIFTKLWVKASTILKILFCSATKICPFYNSFLNGTMILIKMINSALELLELV